MRAHQKISIVMAGMLSFLLFPVPAVAINALGIQAVTVSDLSDSPKADFLNNEAVRYSVSFETGGPSLVLARGTVTFEGADPEVLRLRFAITGEGETAISWDSVVPADARGSALVVISTVSVPGGPEEARASFSIGDTGEEVPPGPDNNSSFICGACHGDLYDAWRLSRHYPAIGCEACHGPGNEHIRAATPETIRGDITARFCNVCHSRNDGTTVEAEGGFIKPMQQHNELYLTAHRTAGDCLTCHDPHYSPSGHPQKAIRRSCSDCHTDKAVYLNMQELACEDCHMPFAVFKSESAGTGLYREADRRTHIVRIKGETAPEEMFGSNGAALLPDDRGGFITLNFACMVCHDGEDAPFLGLDAVRQTHTLAH